MRTVTYTLVQPDNTTTWRQQGTVQISDGRVFLYEMNLAEFFAQFEGKHIEIAVAINDDEWPMDPLIVPLVEAMQRVGIKTIASCQGHVDGQYPHKYPWVAFAENLSDLFNLSQPPHADWYSTIGESPNTVVWRTVAEASTEAELAKLQESIGELAKAIS